MIMMWHCGKVIIFARFEITWNMTTFENIIAKMLSLSSLQVKKTMALLDDGATIPFISRYRKEATGALDEVKIGQINDEYNRLKELSKRKETILSTIEEQGKLTPELRQRIDDSWNSTEIEDLYLPYKPKRKTRAEAARQNGLEPLASMLLLQRDDSLRASLHKYIKGNVKNEDEALAGARDIVAEIVCEKEETRNRLRNVFANHAFITSKVVKGKEAEAQKYQDYFDFKRMLKHCPSHNLLAMRRGEAEGFLRVKIETDDERVLEQTKRFYIRNPHSLCGEQLDLAITDGYKRLLVPSIESEFNASSKDKADDEAIDVFTSNLRQLLLSSPLGQKNVMAIDPGFRTGCKVVCLNAQGELLWHGVIFPHPPAPRTDEAARQLQLWADKYKIEAYAIGDGTAGRETESFVRSLPFNKDRQIFMVSEDGASVYSASAVAREEFPKEDVTVRGAVSIGRRLMDPLAELVKIDPKSIGVGQYQHDVNQTKLKQALDRTVMNAVNSVGVDLNTASRHLLVYVSGLGPQLASNIITYRSENGTFRSRKELMNVPRMGTKAFEQCAGFLRIAGADNPLDNSAVHPERYALVGRMAKDLHCTVAELIKDKELQKQISIDRYVSEDVGLPTLKDILTELDKPGRDPRSKIEEFSFAPYVRTFEDLKSGMELNGIVTNITNFGCFVNIGIHENGLIHISQMSERRISNPADVVSLHQHVRVRILNADADRRRIELKLISKI